MLLLCTWFLQGVAVIFLFICLLLFKEAMKHGGGTFNKEASLVYSNLD